MKRLQINTSQNRDTIIQDIPNSLNGMSLGDRIHFLNPPSFLKRKYYIIGENTSDGKEVYHPKGDKYMITDKEFTVWRGKKWVKRFTVKHSKF